MGKAKKTETKRSLETMAARERDTTNAELALVVERLSDVAHRLATIDGRGASELSGRNQEALDRALGKGVELLDVHRRTLVAELDELAATTRAQFAEALDRAQDRLDQQCARFSDDLVELRGRATIEIQDHLRELERRRAELHRAALRNIEVEVEVEPADAAPTPPEHGPPRMERESGEALHWSPLDVVAPLGAPATDTSANGAATNGSATYGATPKPPWDLPTDDVPGEVMPDEVVPDEVLTVPTFDVTGAADLLAPLTYPWDQEPAPFPPPVEELPHTVSTHTVPTTLFGDVAVRLRPVTVSLTVPALNSSVDLLSRSASGDTMGVAVVHSPHEGTRSVCLRLMVWNAAGWWEWHDLPVNSEGLERRSVMVAVNDVRAAIDALRYDTPGTRVVVRIDRDLTIGTTLCLARQHDGMPSGTVELLEPAELQPTSHGEVAIDASFGQLVLPSRLATVLRSRSTASNDLAIMDGQHYLCSTVPGPTVGVRARIAAPLDSEEAVDSAEERRTAPTTAVEQLVRALSAASAPDELELVVRTGVAYAQRRAASHPVLPPAVIAELLQQGDEVMRAAAASNPSVSEQEWDIASSDLSPSVRAALAGNPSIDSRRLAQLSLDPDAEVRMRVAASTVAGSVLLERLAEDCDGLVRAAVAANANTTATTLELLSRDIDPVVCTAVAQNRNCSEAVLEQLVAIVPVAVMSNPRTPVALLTAGSRVHDRSLRFAVAGNPATPPKCLDALARGDDIQVLRVVADNPSTPSGARRRLRERLQGAA